MKRTQSQPSSRAHALALLRRNRAWSQTQLAAASGVPEATLQAWESGARALKPESLEQLATCMRYDPLQVEGLLFGLRGVVEPPEPPSEPGFPAGLPREAVRRARMEAMRHGLERAREREALELARVRDAQIARERQAADRLVRRLLALTPEQREALREREPGAGFHTWAFVERACEQSLRALPGDSKAAWHWAALALHASVDTDEAVGYRLAAYAHAFLGNARRATGELQIADAYMVYSAAYWEWGGRAAALPLDAGRRLELVAALRRAQGRDADALALYERAVQVSTPEARPLLLLGWAETHEGFGHTGAALDRLLAARHSLGEASAPDLRIRLGWKIADLLSQLDRSGEAIPYLDEARTRLLEGRKAADLALCLWIQARCDAALGRGADAVKSYRRALGDLTAQQRRHEAIEVSFELTQLYGTQGRAAPAKRLAEELGWALKTPGLSTFVQECIARIREAPPSSNESLPWLHKGLTELRRTRPRSRP